MNCRRIFSNIDDMLSFLEKRPELNDSVALKIIVQNLGILKQVQVVDVSKLDTKDKIYLETWLDVCYWINDLAAFVELIALLQYEEFSEKDKLIQDLSNASLGLAYISGRFIMCSSYTQNSYEWLHDGNLCNALMALTRQLFLLSFSLVENSLMEAYDKMVQQNVIEKIESQVIELRKQFDKLKEKLKLDDSITKKIDSEITKIAKAERSPFEKVIRSITKKLLDPQTRRVHINQWLFMTDVRNSLMHKVDTALTSRIITLWGRKFTLEKGISFKNTEFCDQYIIFSISMIEMFLKLTCKFKQNDKWENLRKAFLKIYPNNVKK